MRRCFSECNYDVCTTSFCLTAIFVTIVIRLRFCDSGKFIPLIVLVLLEWYLNHSDLIFDVKRYGESHACISPNNLKTHQVDVLEIHHFSERT